MKHKKVGYIIRKFPVLSETFILNEILELEAQGIEVHIISLEPPSDPRYHKNLHKLKAHISYVPNVLKMRNLWKQMLKAAKQFPSGWRKAVGYLLRQGRLKLFYRFLQSCYISNVASREKIDRFHAHFATRATTTAFLSSLISGIPYSFTAHAVDIFKDTLCQKALKRKIDFADFVVTVSEYNKNYLATNFPGSSGKLLRVYNGIDLGVFRPEMEIISEPFTFLCVARFVEKKGHSILVEACEILKKEGMNFRCWLVGKGKLEQEVKSAIAQKKLQGFVELLGAHTHDEVLERFHRSHAYVLPCLEGKNGNKDGLPVAIVEALACGKPVITTPMTGNPEVVKDGVNGLLVPFGDPVKTAEAMKRLMNDKLFYETLSANARPSVERTFDSRQTIKELASKFAGARA